MKQNVSVPDASRVIYINFDEEDQMVSIFLIKTFSCIFRNL